MSIALLLAATLCDPMWLPVSRDPASTPLVVRMLPDTVADKPAPAFAPRGPALAFEASIRGERGPVRPRYGQAATVLVTGSATRLAQGRGVILIPWQFASDCAPSPWTDSALWVPAGEIVFLSAWLRPIEGWVDRTPTFDVEVKGWQPTWRTNDPRWTGSRDSLLTPEEFLPVFERLPSHADLQSRPAMERAVALLRRRHPQFVDREPARTILGNLDRLIAAARR